jgi:spore coat protein U-like protein
VKTLPCIAMALLGAAWATRAPAAICTISATSLSFGTYAITAGKTTTATMTVSCTKQAGDATMRYQVLLDAGGGTLPDRRLAAGSNTLDYNIYRDAANASIWGTGVAPTSVNSGLLHFGGVPVGGTVTQTFTAYGTIPAQSPTVNNDKPPGTYTNTVTATLRRLTPAPAANLATTVISASATINPGCAIASNGLLAFGTYDPTSVTPLDAATALQFRCTTGSAFDIGLGGVVGSRTLTEPGGDSLVYELYSDVARTKPWGNIQDVDTVSADDGADSTGNGLSTLNPAQVRTVFGRIPAGQVRNAGDYASTLTITVYY